MVKSASSMNAFVANINFTNTGFTDIGFPDESFLVNEGQSIGVWQSELLVLLYGLKRSQCCFEKVRGIPQRALC